MKFLIFLSVFFSFQVQSQALLSADAGDGFTVEVVNDSFFGFNPSTSVNVYFKSGEDEELVCQINDVQFPENLTDSEERVSPAKAGGYYYGSASSKTLIDIYSVNLKNLNCESELSGKQISFSLSLHKKLSTRVVNMNSEYRHPQKTSYSATLNIKGSESDIELVKVIGWL